ncbi:hypothetical protein HELRODRAFT_160092 [Helobdella robusta]|uniref:Uncharacterized protein n=1 Tax=Helobdella robusta TaxID=6412 RepID=T1EPS0_HELRO|nr:hypothetical protein HELRODRAFT_160092 [Helobdella robusta]ESO05989.1 hypothetical protein HELRODRAFT_160092 [Helobdella robusta]
MAINSFAIPILTYSFGIIFWTKAELNKLGRVTRKLLTLYGMLHPKADKWWKRAFGGTINLQKEAITGDQNMYLTNEDNNNLNNVDKLKIKLKKLRKEQICNKPLHGQYFKELEKPGKKFRKLLYSELLISLESFLDDLLWTRMGPEIICKPA